MICIGNLSVGGTGKTPHTEYIIRLLKDKYRIAVLSRGYKRKTSGFILADSESSSLEIGDEPFQMKNKFPDILVAVDANRRRGIQNLLSLPEKDRPEVILLDDAYQHRYVHPSLSIVLSDYHRLFYNDKLMPTGHLREPISNINRTDIVVVTKCDEDMKPIDFRVIEENMTSPGKLILVTEKDAARLKNSPLVPESWKKYLYYLPIVIRFYNEQSFNETIKKHIITFPKNNILQNKYE